MYCPHCGVNNDRGEGLCFICHKPLPSLTPPPAAAPRVREPAKPAEVCGGVGDRMLALIFDRIVIGCVLMAFGSFAVSRWGAIDWRVPSIKYGGAAAVLLTIFLYHLIFEGAFGTTLGKAILGLQVRTLEGRGRFASVAIRNLLRIVDSLGSYLIGFLFAMFTPMHQRVGDLVGGTVVMDAPGLGRGARAAMMVLWLAVIGTTIWLSNAFCPTCRPDVPWTVQRLTPPISTPRSR